MFNWFTGLFFNSLLAAKRRPIQTYSQGTDYGPGLVPAGDPRVLRPILFFLGFFIPAGSTQRKNNK